MYFLNHFLNALVFFYTLQKCSLTGKQKRACGKARNFQLYISKIKSWQPWNILQRLRMPLCPNSISPNLVKRRNQLRWKTRRWRSWWKATKPNLQLSTTRWTQSAQIRRRIQTIRAKSTFRKSMVVISPSPSPNQCRVRWKRGMRSLAFGRLKSKTSAGLVTVWIKSEWLARPRESMSGRWPNFRHSPWT